MGQKAGRKSEQFELQLGDRGRIVLPSTVRQRLSLNPGDRMVLIVDESGEMHLVGLRQQIEKCRGMFRHLAPHGRLASDELITDRRKEAEREEG